MVLVLTGGFHPAPIFESVLQTKDWVTSRNMSAASPLLLGKFEDWGEFYEYMTLYGIHLLFGAVLSAVTIFRREMSCNRVFHQEEAPVDGEQNEADQLPLSPDSSISSDAIEEETEDLLDQAGMYCSGQPIVHLASMWMQSFPCDDEDGEEHASPSKLLHGEVTPTDLLERVGNFYSGEPLLAAVALFLYHQDTKKVVSIRAGVQSNDPFIDHLPPDVYVHIASFLHPRDVISLSCVSRSHRALVDEPNSSNAIWRALWERDYAWVVDSWSAGKQALQRSALDRSFVIDKDFYFRFGESYLNYVLAGRNTTGDCMVGLHSHIYDITSFVDSHPGSPDTLMVHSGKDSTRFFEDMGHSLVARRLAKKLCVLVDLSQLSLDGWGLRPTEATLLEDAGCSESSRFLSRFPGAGENLLLGRKQRARGGTLKKVRMEMESERSHLERHLEQKYGSDTSVLGAVNPYYDPFRKEWRVWYTDTNLQTVFLPA